ncbi:hypothetical protein ABD68_12595 [Bacillus endophyticus]|nr:hypothetical protein [Priestia endophytica]
MLIIRREKHYFVKKYYVLSFIFRFYGYNTKWIGIPQETDLKRLFLFLCMKYKLVYVKHVRGSKKAQTH